MLTASYVASTRQRNKIGTYSVFAPRLDAIPEGVLHNAGGLGAIHTAGAAAERMAADIWVSKCVPWGRQWAGYRTRASSATPTTVLFEAVKFKICLGRYLGRYLGPYRIVISTPK